MVIQEAHKTISELKKALPESFVFVLDTTDRSFLYKSTGFEEFEHKIILIDHDHGIDKLTRESGYHISRHDDNLVGLRNIGINTYVGFCLPNASLLDINASVAETILRNEKDQMITCLT